LSLRLRAPERAEGLLKTDVLVVGAGPAGLSAALYARRFGLGVVVVADVLGGQVALAHRVENYLGFESISGAELALRFRRHAELFGAKIVLDRVAEIREEGEVFRARTERRGVEVESKAVILAIGAKKRKLGVPGEDRLVGRGVSYCAVCDAPLFKGSKRVAVVGGGDSAMEGAILASQFAEEVVLVHRRSEFRAQPILVEAATKRSNVKVLTNSVVVEVLGKDRVEGVRVKNLLTGEEAVIEAEGVFVEVGREPDRAFAEMMGLRTDEEGYILVNERMETSKPGVFAAGDCTSMWKGLRQIITAAAQGAVAAASAYEYLTKKLRGAAHAAP